VHSDFPRSGQGQNAIYEKKKTYHFDDHFFCNAQPSCYSAAPYYTIMSQSIVPTISSGTAGPLGILHLPRLWQKASLAAAGKLHSDYPGCGMGYDQMVLDGLGIEREAFLAFIATKPTYVQTEVWVKANATKLNAESVAALNAAITGYIHSDETRTGICSAVGRADDGSIRDAINLNNLDDWNTFHGQELA
jgi:hypothetical protein